VPLLTLDVSVTSVWALRPLNGDRSIAWRPAAIVVARTRRAIASGERKSRPRRDAEGRAVEEERKTSGIRAFVAPRAPARR
jgi:hypothetical protein